ncbi:MAG: chemotaxis protein CheB [Bacteroidota bacterium]
MARENVGSSKSKPKSTSSKKKVKTETLSLKNTPYVIGIGASAGGLMALKDFFDHVPADCQHSFVIIQHLSPDYKSLMAELLARNTSLPIHEAGHNLSIKAGSIYLIPAGKNMTYSNEKLQLTDKPSTNDLNLPIDIFFRSLAKGLNERAIGIILSGTGTDGSRGVRAINEAGGMTMVQSPATVEFDGMPNSAIATGSVDFILPVKQLPGALIDFINSPIALNGEETESVEKDKATISKILKIIQQETGVDFAGYKQPMLVRRLIRRMHINKCSNLKQYYQFIEGSEQEVNILYREFMIGVTKFFRDDSVFESLAKNLLPKLVKSKKDHQEIKVWCAGCSTGEEVYTIAMIIDEVLAQQGKKNPVKIFATDIDQNALEVASRGAFSESIVADLTSERLEKYFLKKGDHYLVVHKLRNQAIFSRHNVIKDPPLNKLDLISCRNLMIYLNSETQEMLLTKFHYALNEGAILMLGSSESIGQKSTLFTTADRKWKLYLNNSSKSKGIKETIGSHYYKKTINLHTPPIHSQSKRTTQNNLFSEVLNDTLVDEFGVAAVYVDDRYNMIHGIGNFKKYVTLPDHHFSLNVMDMLPESLSIATGTALRKVAKEKEKVLYKGAKWREDDQIRTINILVKAFGLETFDTPYYLITFIQEKVQRSTVAVINDVPENKKAMLRINELEEELKESRENLQTSIQDVETSNEELQSTNEELLSSNEELQSMNEELQSVNEELHTVNSELQYKIDELITVNNDMDNLMKSTHIGTIFLDDELNIRKFTPNITDQFNVFESDVGRPITHFTSKFGQDDEKEFLTIIHRVLKSGKYEQKEIKTQDGIWYLQRIYPFVNSQNMINGVVITFIDIMNLKSAHEKADKLAQKLQSKVKELEQSNEALSRFNKTAVGREIRMIELKKNINDLHRRLGEQAKYDLSFVEE